MYRDQPIAIHANSRLRLVYEMARLLFRTFGGLTQRSDVVEDPKRTAVGGNDKIVPVNDQVADRGYRQVELQRLPMIAIVKRDIDSEFGAGVEQPLLLWVFANGVNKVWRGQSGGDASPSSLP